MARMIRIQIASPGTATESRLSTVVRRPGSTSDPQSETPVRKPLEPPPRNQTENAPKILPPDYYI